MKLFQASSLLLTFAQMSSSPPQLPSSPAAADVSSQGMDAPSSPLFLAPSSDQLDLQQQRLSSDILSQETSRRRPTTRNDVQSSDMLSSPMRDRRLFTQTSTQSANNTQNDTNLNIGSSSPFHNGGNIPEISSPLRGGTTIPAFSSSVNGSSTGIDSEMDGSDDNNVQQAGTGPVRVIWGTNVSITDCAEKFRNFLMSFTMRKRKELEGELDFDLENDDKHYYVDLLNQLKSSSITNLNLDVRNLLAVPESVQLYTFLLTYPQEVIPIMDQTIKDSIISILTEDELNDQDLVNAIESKVYKIRPFNIGNKRGMRELNPQDIDKLISIKGLVIRSTSIIPDMKSAFFKCKVCDHTMVVENERGLINEPTVCPRQACLAKNSMQLIHNRSVFTDKQVVKLQETPDLVPDGQTPHSVSLCLYDELVDSCRAGDRIEVTGIFKSSAVRVNPRQRTLKALFKTYMDVVHIKKINARRMGVDSSTLENELRDQEEVEEVRKLSEDEIERIKQISQRKDIYELLSRSLAPSIFELDDVKKGILLQLFGGTNKKSIKGPKTRGDINILLCGDPSTSKSQMLQYVHKIAPRGIYTSGKGSSAVGLTAYVTKDIETKQLVLESGALVLSDGGVCCIDEFDKMTDQTRSVLHEVMEQQTISIAKAGIITTLNARTSILASANPIESRYNPNLPVTKNIDLPPPLLSRFDLVYLILDKVDEDMDTKLATHIANMYMEDRVQSVNENEILPVEFLTAYVQYAKENIKPRLTSRSRDELVRAYVDMRKQGEDLRQSGTERRITATTRQLESMIRLSEAHAKLHLREEVLVEDVYEAVRLIKSAIKDYATDPLTGKIDMDLIQTGKSAKEREISNKLGSAVVDVLQRTGGDHELDFLSLIDQVQAKLGSTVEPSELSEVISQLATEDKVLVFGQGNKRTITLNRG